MIDIRMINKTKAEILMAPQDKVKIILNGNKEVVLTVNCVNALNIDHDENAIGRIHLFKIKK